MPLPPPADATPRPSHVTSAADRVGAGLEPARPPGRSGPASGSTSSARPGPGPAPRRSWRPVPARRHRLRSGRAVAVHAGPRGARHRRRARALPRRTSPAQPRPDRLAVTKALTAIDPDHPELAAARDAGIPVEPWQQVVADAAVGSDARRRRRDARQEHDRRAGWSTSSSSAGADPSAFVGALLPASITGGPPATARWGSGDAFVVEADEYAGNFDAYRPDLAILTSAEWDHPDVFADLAAVVADLRGVAAPRAARRDARGQRRRPGGRGRRRPPGRLARHRSWPTPWSIRPRSGSGGYARAIAERFATAPDRRRRCSAGSPRATPRARPLELARPRPAGRAADGPARRPPAATTRPTRWPSPGPPPSSASRPAAIATHLASFAGVGRRLERKGEAAGVVVYDDYGHHPTAIRETLAAVRQREPGRRVWAVYEPLTYHRTAAMLDAVRRRPGRGRRGGDRRHLGRARPGHDDHLGGATSPTPIAARRPGIPVLAPGCVEATADALAAEVRRRRRRAGHGRRAQATASASGCWTGLEVTPMIDYAAAGELLEAYGRAWADVRRRRLGRALHRGCRVP